jgi:nucleolar protein 6
MYNPSAGGGGANSEHRKAKIQAKNEKLNDERSRQAKEIKKDKKKYENKPAADTSGANAVEVPAEDDKWAGVHPSRRGRL